MALYIGRKFKIRNDIYDVKRNILAKISGDFEEIAITENEQLVDYFKVSKTEITRGSVVIGIVADVVPSLEAYFVDIGEENNCYLPFKYSAKDLKKGNLIPVQVVKLAKGDKGCTLSAILSITGKYCVISEDVSKNRISAKIKNPDKRKRLLNLIEENKIDNRGIVLRTNSKNADKEKIIADIKKTNESFENIMRTGKVGEIVYSAPSMLFEIMRTFNPAKDVLYINNMDIFNDIFEEYSDFKNPSPIKYYDKEYDMFDFFGVSNKIQSAFGSQVWLKSGGRLVFDYTEAMCVIDVNTAKSTKGKNFEENVYSTNLEAAKEIATQIRLRHLSGIIIIDFIDMNQKQNSELDSMFREYLKKDTVKMNVAGFTKLGNYELTRSRKNKMIEI